MFRMRDDPSACVSGWGGRLTDSGDVKVVAEHGRVLTTARHLHDPLVRQARHAAECCL